MTEAATCPKCNDTGKVVYDIPAERISDTITMTGGYGSELCECRKDETRIRGKAAWWTLEDVKSFSTGMILGKATIVVEAEVPVSADNFPLVRDRDNFYWPAMARIEVPEGTQTAFELRDLAKLLIEAADWMDKFDADRAAIGAAQ